MTELVEVLILAAVALFVLSRLYVALGRDDGPPEGKTREQTVPVSPQPERSGDVGSTEKPVFTGPAAGGLEEINRLDPTFNTRDFLMGAKAAYEMIVAAYARGDRDALRPLLDDDVYEAWDNAIAEREAGGDPAYDLLRIRKVEIDTASVEDGIARVAVRYEAELGDGERTRPAREVWTYKRPVQSDDPNWVLDDVEAAA
ncbi:MAG: Tim44/TimA family putative adaptor protein [Pseudomonadota bacterium]